MRCVKCEHKREQVPHRKQHFLFFWFLSPLGTLERFKFLSKIDRNGKSTLKIFCAQKKKKKECMDSLEYFLKLV